MIFEYFETKSSSHIISISILLYEDDITVHLCSQDKLVIMQMTTSD